MTEAENLTFNEEAGMEAPQERSAVPHVRDILKRGHDKMLKRPPQDAGLEMCMMEIDETLLRDLHSEG